MSTNTEMMELLLEEEQLLQEQAGREQKQSLGTNPVPDDGFLNADRTPVGYDAAGITKSDIALVQSVNLRKLNQLQGKTTAPQSLGDVSAQVLSYVANPLREAFGGEAVEMGNFVNPVEALRADGIQRKMAAADAGLSNGPGISWGARALQSLALRDSDKAAAAKNELDARFGEDTKIGRDTVSDQMVYLDPTDNRLYPLDPLGIDGGDLAQMLGPAIVAIPEITGTVAGALNKKKATSKLFRSGEMLSTRQKRELAGGAFGAAIGEFARITLGQAFGINQDVSFERKVYEGLKESGLSLGPGVAFESFVSFARLLKSSQAERAIPSSVLREMVEAFDRSPNIRADQAVDALNKVLRQGASDLYFTPNIGQLQNNPEILDVVAALKRPGSQEKTLLIQQEEQNLQAQMQMFAQNQQSVGAGEPIGAFELGSNIHGVMDKSLAAMRHAAQAPLQAAQDVSQQMAEGLLKIDSLEAGTAARDALSLEEKIFVDAADVSYRQLDNDIDAAGLVVDSAAIREQLLDLDINDSLVKSKSIKDRFKEGTLDLDVEAQWPVGLIGRTVRSLRKELRATTEPSDAGEIKAALAILNRAKVAALKDSPELLLRQQMIDTNYRWGRKILDDGVVNGILKNRKNIADSEIFKKIIVNGNSTTGKDVADIIIGHPEAQLAMKGGINKLYEDTVMDGGMVNLKKHEQFVERYIKTAVITPYYKKGELAELERGGGIGKLLIRETEKRNNALKRVNNLFEAKIENLDGRALFNKVWGEEKQGMARGLKVALRDNPEIWKSFQAEVLDDIKNTAMPNGQFNVVSLDNLLVKKKRMIKEFIGEGYYNNLQVLKNTLDITGRVGTAAPIDKSNMVMDLMRAYAGVFTTTGRFITAANRFRSSRARELITQMLLDPDKLKKLHAMRRARSGSKTAGLIATQLGFSEYAIMGPPDDEAYNALMKEQIEWEKKRLAENKQRRQQQKQTARDAEIKKLLQQQQRLSNR